MATKTEELQFDAQYIEKYSQERNEPQWLTDLRLDALSRVQELPMPKPEKTRIVGWNFTDFEHQVEASSLRSVDDLPDHIKSLVGQGDTSGNLLVHHNGQSTIQTLSEDLKNKGVIFTDFATAVQEHGDLIKKYLFSEAINYDEDRLIALHAALINGGTFLYVPRNVNVEVPLQSLYYQDSANAGFINHVIVIAEESSSVTYVENYLSEQQEGSAVANMVTEVYVGANAKVEFGAVDNLSSDVTTYVNRRAHVSRDGQIEWAIGHLNNGHTISENYTALVGDGSIGHTKAVSIANNDQKQNFTNNVKHFGKASESNLLIHGVQKEAANSIFNGITKIEHGASKAYGDQTQRVLMLSEKARGDANPILLIDEDDVEAGHAASVGRIDPVQLYYLMSRGISRTEAERLIIHGFLAPVVNQLPIDEVKEQLVEVVEGKVN